MRFHIKGVTLIIDYYFVAVLTLMLVVFGNSNILMCFVFCILHELGHLAAMAFFGEKAKSVILGYFGMKIVCSGRILPHAEEIAIAAAGPLINLILAIFCRLFNFPEAMQINLGLALFNLLPVKMLDGGRILSCFVSDKALKTVGVIAGVLMSFLGAAAAIYTKSNFLILIVSLYILIGAIKD